MKRNSKFTALAVSLGLAVSMFAGCGEKEAQGDVVDTVAEATDTANNVVRVAVTDISGIMESVTSTGMEVPMDASPAAAANKSDTGTDSTATSTEDGKSSGIAATVNAVSSAMVENTQVTASAVAGRTDQPEASVQASMEDSARPSGTQASQTTSSVQTSTTQRPSSTQASSAQASSTQKPSGTQSSAQASQASCVHGDWSGGYEVTDLGNCRSHVHGERTCGKCGYREVLEDYDTESHAFGTPVVVYGNCTQEGYQYHVCARCGAQGDTISMGTDPNAHDYVQSGSSVVQSGDCIFAEIIDVTYTCSRCGDSYTHQEQGSTDPGNHNNVRDDGTCVCGTVVFTPEPAPVESSTPEPVPESGAAPVQ